MNPIDEILREADRALCDSFAAQQEAFLMRHADKIGGYTLAHYPRVIEPDTETYVCNQRIALIPNDVQNTGEYLPWILARERGYPCAVLRFELRQIGGTHGGL